MCTDKIESNIHTVGAKKLDFCGDRTYYFCGGKDQLSKDNYDACLASNAEAKCIADREKARTSGHKGKYGPFAGPQTCGETRWMCNGIMMETEEVYKQSSCGKTKTCGIEDQIYAPELDWPAKSCVNNKYAFIIQPNTRTC